MFLTSFSALPASCRCRLFMCDVFFFGTARSTPSQMSARRAGIFSDITGIDMVTIGYMELERGRSGGNEAIWMAA